MNKHPGWELPPEHELLDELLVYVNVIVAFGTVIVAPGLADPKVTFWMLLPAPITTLLEPLPMLVTPAPVALMFVVPVTVSPVSVPTEVSDEARTFEASVPPVSVPAAAGITGMSAATRARNVGAPVEPFGPANTVFAAALLSVKLKAGVVLAVVTLVVNSGDRVPALKLVTVPLLLSVVGTHCSVPELYCSTWLLVGAVAETALPWIPTTEVATEPADEVTSPVSPGI